MSKEKLSDSEAKEILQAWPTSTKKLWVAPEGEGRWIRGQPRGQGAAGPRIASPGARLFTTQPDGLFIFFSSLESCDLVAVEVCGTVQNLNDKRSRYVPSSHSLVLNCGNGWMREKIVTQGGGSKARWSAAGLHEEPTGDCSVPVRHLRVLYALPNDTYEGWCVNHTPTGYEYFCPHSSLGSYHSQKMQQFLRRMSIASQFYLKR